MANATHLRILKQGMQVWNKWRELNPEIRPDLFKADLAGANLSRSNLKDAFLNGANLQKARLGGIDFSHADLRGANMSEADLALANLCRANLTYANLTSADLRAAALWEAQFSETKLQSANLRLAKASQAQLDRADLRSANLTEADLVGAILNATDLRLADLSGADLSGALLIGVHVTETNFQDSKMAYTTLANVDLSRAKGLGSIRHFGPSNISIDILYRTSPTLPDNFLRGAGVPEPLITNMKSFLGRMEALQFYSCFISYSGKDHDLAERLYADLQANGVRCWFAPEDLKIGEELRSAFDEAIRAHDKLLVLLSGHSVNSAWVKKEVETAFEKERQQDRIVLFPIRLDDAVMETTQAWAADIRRTRHVGDFRDWKDHDSYKKAFDRLLRDLKSEAKAGSAERK